MSKDSLTIKLSPEDVVACLSEYALIKANRSPGRYSTQVFLLTDYSAEVEMKFERDLTTDELKKAKDLTREVY